MRDVVKWSFTERRSNEEIAQLLHTTPQYVAWVLQEAAEWLLVRDRQLDQLQPVQPLQSNLEQQLRDGYPHLKKVHIVFAGKVKTDAQYAGLVQQWGRAAAQYFDRLAEDAEQVGVELHVGVSGGQTILEVVSQLPERDRPRVHFYGIALVGRGFLRKSSLVGPETNATIGWARSGRNPGQCHFATVSPYDKQTSETASLEQRRGDIVAHIQELAAIPSIRQAVKDLQVVDVVFASLGIVNPSGTNPGYSNAQIDRLSMTGLVKSLGVSPEELSAQGAIGDLSYCFFNADGEEQPRDHRGKNLPKEYWRFFLTAGHFNPNQQGLEFYRQMVENKETVIVIAGIHKEAAIHAALKAKLFNVWFTDEATARYILALK
jgi:DNA-binding transcriptional regulator LsrR (DeoR family)